MKRIYEFKCSQCLNLFEEYCEYKHVCICPSCGANADKIISATRSKLEGYTGSFPSAADAWAKRHEKSPKSE